MANVCFCIRILTLDSAVIIPVSPSSGVVEDRVEVSCGGRVELCVTSSLSALAQDPRHFRHCLEHQYLLRRMKMRPKSIQIQGQIEGFYRMTHSTFFGVGRYVVVAAHLWCDRAAATSRLATAAGHGIATQPVLELVALSEAVRRGSVCDEVLLQERSCFEFPLCLSRACLGKIMINV